VLARARWLGEDDHVNGDLTTGMSAVVFDFFGTLTPISPPRAWADNTAQMAAVMGVQADALGRMLEQTFPDRITGAFGDVRQTMQTLAEMLGVRLSDAQLDAATSVRRSVQESMFALRPETLPVIGALRDRGLAIGLVSDCTSELPDAWPRLPLAGVVDAAVFSCVERARKPDSRLFLKVAAELDAAPSRCLYIGDGGGNELTGATAVGMTAVLLAGQDFQQYRVRDSRHGDAGWIGQRIESLTELSL
jgi:putative hydrolase of the HAD superfamily